MPRPLKSAGSMGGLPNLSRPLRQALRLLDGRADLREQRVAFLAPATYAYVVMQWVRTCAHKHARLACAPPGASPPLALAVRH